MKIKITDTHKLFLFHVFLWSIWLYLSLSNVHEEEFKERAIIVSVLIVLTHIPLFVVNTAWLIPQILHKKGLTKYLWSLLGVMTAFVFIHGLILSGLDQYFISAVHPYRGLKFSRGIIALTLVAAISTGYSLLNYVVVQEKEQQEKQKERLQSELSFLRSQISPHFIFNILNSIVYLIRSKSDLAEPVTLKLSELMRYMLYESEHAQITLEKEIAYLKNYIELQKIRFEEDVAIHLNITGDVNSQLIEPLLLIPFVENAFKHGVGMVHQPTIDINMNIRDHDLSFSVQNKIALETLTDKDESSGIGLKNVQRRLELLYPEKHQLEINNEKDWFSVKLNLTLN